MFGKRKELEAELEQLRSDLRRTTGAFEAKTRDYNALMQQMNKQREKYTYLKDAKLYGDEGFELAQRAVDLIRYGPMFRSADPSAPVLSHSDVERGMRELLQETHRTSRRKQPAMTKVAPSSVDTGRRRAGARGFCAGPLRPPTLGGHPWR